MIIAIIFQEELVKKKYLKYYSDFKSVCNDLGLQKKSLEITSTGLSIDCSSTIIDEKTYAVEDKGFETCLNLKFDQHIDNKYSTDFNLFESELNDILSKVRAEQRSLVSTQPCFTPLIVLVNIKKFSYHSNSKEKFSPFSLLSNKK
jgi:hypothetical protein